VRRRAHDDAGPRGLRGHQGRDQNVCAGAARKVGDRGITVNNIHPGPIDTDLNPASGDWAASQKANAALNRYGNEVDDVAALTAFVAGPEAAYITGASLTVDCGTNA
jgi:3-oxoacyl-[acyl-carrier protein] reductase